MAAAVMAAHLPEAAEAQGMVVQPVEKGAGAAAAAVFQMPIL